MDDLIKINNELLELAKEIEKTTNDSLFTANNSGSLSNTYSKKDDLTGKLKDTIKALSVGQVYGPYIDNNTYMVAKLVGKKMVADSAKASHILRSVTNGDAVQLVAALKYIDSIKTAITSGSISFSDAATNNSQDPGSAQNGGDLGTFAQGAMVPKFNDAVFNGKEGSLYTVTTEFGVHLIKVEKQIYSTNEMKYNIAYIIKPIIPSEATQNAIEDKVMGLLETTKTIEDLNKLASDDLKVETAGGVKKNDYTFASLGSGQTSRDIIRWAYESDTDKGEISSSLYTYTDDANYVDSKHVIVGQKSIEKRSLTTVEAVKISIEHLVINEKKVSKIKSKFTGQDINAIETK